jgi:hypothetical protein
MRRERDKQSVKAVGAICLGLGALLTLLTLVGSLGLLAALGARADLVRGSIAFFTGLVMGSTLMSCGTQLQRIKLYSSLDIDAMRHAWAGLLIVMVAGAAVGYYVIWPLADLAVFVIIMLLLIRPAVIRLSH